MGKKASKFGSSSMSHFQVPSSWVSRTASRTLSLLIGIHTPWHSFCRAIFKALRLFGQKGILQGHRWMHQCEIKKLHSKNWQPLVIHVNRNSDRTLPDCFHECNGCYFFAATSMRFMTGPQKKTLQCFSVPKIYLVAWLWEAATQILNKTLLNAIKSMAPIFHKNSLRCLGSQSMAFLGSLMVDSKSEVNFSCATGWQAEPPALRSPGAPPAPTVSGHPHVEVHRNVLPTEASGKADLRPGLELPRRHKK